MNVSVGVLTLLFLEWLVIALFQYLHNKLINIFIYNFKKVPNLYSEMSLVLTNNKLN